MAGHLSPLQNPQHLADAAELTSGNRGLAIVIAVVALAALGVAVVLVRQVLAAA